MKHYFSHSKEILKEDILRTTSAALFLDEFLKEEGTNRSELMTKGYSYNVTTLKTRLKKLANHLELIIKREFNMIDDNKGFINYKINDKEKAVRIIKGRIKKIKRQCEIIN